MSDKEVRIRITGDVSDLLKKLEAIKDAFEKLDSNRSTNKAINDLIDGLKDVEERAEDASDSLDNLTDATRRIDKNDGLSEMADDLREIDDRADEAAESLEDIAKSSKDVDTDSYDALQKQIESLYSSGEKAQEVIKNINESMGDMKVSDLDFGVSDKSLKDVAKNSDSIGSDIASGFVSGTVAGKIMADTMSDVVSEAKDLVAALNKMDDNTPLEDKVKTFDNLAEAIKKATREVEDYEFEIKDLEDELEDLKKQQDALEMPGEDADFEDWADYQQTFEYLEHQIQGVNEELKVYRQRLEEAKSALSVFENQEQKYGNEFSEQLKMYTELRDKVKRFIDENEECVATNERLAKVMDEVARAFHNMFDDVPENEFVDYMQAAEESMKEFMKTAELVTFDNLAMDLNSLGEALDDKTEKMIKLKKANSELDGQSRKYAHALEEEAKALKDYAKNAGYAFEIVERLGDDGGYDVRIAGNKNAFDDIDPAKLERYNRAVNEYLSLIEETNGQISKRFLDDDGKFDVNKYIADLERFGKPLDQLVAKFKSLRQQALEYLKVQDNIGEAKSVVEYWEQVKKEAQALKDLAEAEEKAAQTSQESYQARQKLAQASKELAEAEKELAKAKENVVIAEKEASKTEQERLSDQAKTIKSINEQAEALRKLGAAVDDIERADIEAFDKSLASKLDNTFKHLFDKDIPKNLREFADDIKAAFSEFVSFDFSNGLDLLKDSAKGFAKYGLSEIPTAAKVAGGSVAAISTAALKLYDIGQRQFFEGLASAANRLQPVINMLQNLGQEAVAAFEEITDTDVDLSSLMALGPNFQYQMQQVGAIAGSNDEQLKKLTKTAEHLGGTTKYTASQVGEAFQYMAMAGYDTEEMLSSIEGTLALSIASGTDLAETTDIVTDYMTALGMEANSTSEFVDKLAATITSSNTNVTQFGNSMKQVASQAGTLGVSMTDLSTAIGLQANAGVKGSKAGTALKNMLANMNSPTEKQAEALKKLGFTLDETTGSYLMTTDGVVDLEKNVKHLMKQIEKMGSLKASALIGQVVGKEALPGVMALLGQGEEAWTELSNTIENSTGKVQYWNECMSITGRSGEEATKQIENMKKVFEDTELAASSMNVSTDELANAIALLGHNGDVTAKNVTDLLGVIDSMNTATGDVEALWRSLDTKNNDDVNIGWDYDGTVAKIAADTQGLTQAQKEELQTRLKSAETYEEAKKIAEQYGNELKRQKGIQVDLSGIVERNSFSTMTYADKLKYLRDNYKEMGKEAFEAKIQELGLGESLNEIREICQMSDEDFKLYTDNLETVKGMAEQLAEAMDLTTKNALLNLASAIENVAIAAFNSIEPALKGATDAFNEFFDTWHEGEKNEFTFSGLEKGLADLEQKLEEQKGNIQQVIVDAFTGFDRFINEGAFQSLLDMGTHIIQSICDGIMEAKEQMED